MTEQPWCVLVNPAAGRGADLEARAREALASRDIPGDVHATRDAEHLRVVVDAAVAAGGRRFVAVGGDGTVNLVADALLRHSWPVPPLLGILPGGSGCDFLRTFGMPQRLEEAAAHLAGDATYRVDVGVLRGEWGERHFVNAAEAGLGAAVVRRAARLPARLGRFRYQLAVWPTLVRFPPAEIELVAGRRRYSGPAVMVVMANGQFFGGGMNVAPRAMLVDGELDVQVFSGPKRQAVVLQPRITRGTHLTHKGVRRMSAAAFTLRTDPAWPVEADGEYLGEGPVTGEVLPGALDVKI